MTTIRTREQLKDAFIIVHALEEMAQEHPLSHKTRKYIVDTKKAIRQANKRHNEVVFVFGDYDSYTELIEFPEGMDLEQAEDYFDDVYRLHYYPSPYDCTGQKFTVGCKFFMRHGRVYCYHSVALDV